MDKDFIFEIYKDKRTVFSIQEIAMLIEEPDFNRLKQRINYYVKKRKLRNIRRGIYVKEKYSPEELACKIFTPAYISLEYVLQKAGIIFQYSENITVVSYLTRTIEIDEHVFRFRKVKNEILHNTAGIYMDDTGIASAVTERALLDILYLEREFHFDTAHNLNRETVQSLLPVYRSAQMDQRIRNLLINV